ncbi:hypothetical protein LCGC14_0263250 [marine sediment metagenome]|uniref:Uncharacterized protein n=1 Tax=marine sediment metagenome TaxID=412755 RepID=A0A0F9U1D8_9ZZZZ
MPLIRIQSYPGNKQVFIASEAMSDLAVVVYSPAGARYVEAGEEASQERVAGVLKGVVTSALGSGGICRVVTDGIVSGVMCGIAVQAGDRVVCASTGHIQPLNTILQRAASGAIFVAIASGLLSGVASGVQGPLSGAIIVASGALMGTFFTTGRVFAKALASGGAGSGIPILVGLG